MNLGAVRADDWIKFSNRVRAESYCDMNGNNCLVPSRTLLPNCASGQTIVMGSGGQWGCGNNTSTPTAPSATYAWSSGSWGACVPFSAGASCGGYYTPGSQSRTVQCVNTANGTIVQDSLCTGARPASSQSCSAYVPGDVSHCGP